MAHTSACTANYRQLPPPRNSPLMVNYGEVIQIYNNVEVKTGNTFNGHPLYLILEISDIIECVPTMDIDKSPHQTSLCHMGMRCGPNVLIFDCI